MLGQNGSVRKTLTTALLLAALPALSQELTPAPEAAESSPTVAPVPEAAPAAPQEQTAEPTPELTATPTAPEAPSPLTLALPSEEAPEAPESPDASAAAAAPVAPAPEAPVAPEPPPAQPSPAEPLPSPEPVAAAPTAEPAPEPAPAAPAPEPAPAPAEPAVVATAEPRELPTAPAALAAAPAVPYQGIVRIEVAVRRPDYGTPWQGGGFGQGNGTGFMVSPGVFMTNAHVVANAERIYVSLYADSRKFKAHVKHVAHDADLALIEVEDITPFAQLPCLQFCDRLPHLEETVRAIGYPIGGKRLSVTRGIVSRIESIPYSHPRNQSHLTVQMDAAINPGNSGGPVLLGDKVIGVAFQGLREANSTGYMIPIPVIARFLRDVEDGHYDQYVDLGVQFFPLQNPAMRRHHGLADDAMGALVGEVITGSCCDGVLQQGDVVLTVNGLPVDSSGMIELEGERMELEELAERSFKGDTVSFELLRGGQRQQAEATLAPLPAGHVTAQAYDELPRYVVYGGLVFQPLQANVVAAHRVKPISIMAEVEHFTKRGGSLQKQDVVLLTKVLPDEVNARFEGDGSGIVTKVNGVEVQGLAHLHELLYAPPAEGQPRPAYTVIELKDAPRPLVFDNAAIDAANARISARYNIPEAARLSSQPQQP